MICFLLHFQSRARQEDPEQARLKQKAKEVCSPPADPELGKKKKNHLLTQEELHLRALPRLRTLTSFGLAVAPLADLKKLLLHTVRSGTVGQRCFE